MVVRAGGQGFIRLPEIPIVVVVSKLARGAGRPYTENCKVSAGVFSRDWNVSKSTPQIGFEVGARRREQHIPSASAGPPYGQVGYSISVIIARNRNVSES